MPDENEERLERQRTAEIVAAYVRHHQLAAAKVPALISTIHATLGQLGRSAQPVIEPAVPIRRSVHRDYVVCLDCGWRGKVLRRHIGSVHELSPNEYRAKWSLSREHPLTAPGYSDQRSGLAKQLGLGRRAQGSEEAESPEPKGGKQSKKRPRQQPTATT